jgi:mannose-1-phosphate guanylyltransferase
MQAIILSGGLGTRLRPLTYTRPKSLMPLSDTTILGHILRGLPKTVDKAVLACNYMIDDINRYIKENRDELPCEVVIAEEMTPLGTGGAIKNCQEHITDTFLAFNGDLVSSLDIGKFIEFHKEKGGIGAISLREVPNPTAFGIIEVDMQQRILRFKEKPKPEEVFSNLINAGCYVLEPEVFDHIAPKKAVSIEREVFPFILEKRMYGYEFKGYWIDCGTPQLYLAAQRTLLEQRGMATYQGKGVKVKKGAVVEDRSLIYDNTVLESGARVKGSVIFKGSRIGARTVVENAIIGEGCTIGDDCSIPDGCIIGDGKYLMKNTHLEKGTKIPEEA